MVLGAKGEKMKEKILCTPISDEPFPDWQDYVELADGLLLFQGDVCKWKEKMIEELQQERRDRPRYWASSLIRLMLTTKKEREVRKMYRSLRKK